VELKLQTPEMFRFDENVKYLANAVEECLYQIREGRIRRAIALGREAVLAEIGAQGDGALTVRDLSEIRLSARKSEYLIETAGLIAEGKLSKELLWEAGDIAKAEKLLTGIRGIGPWTANYVLMRCLRYPSAFPIDDVGLHNAIKRIMGMDSKPTKEEIRELAAGWKNWEAYATFYLWRSLS
jgi:DNA-3-methyladenine glycosylase II